MNIFCCQIHCTVVFAQLVCSFNPSGIFGLNSSINIMHIPPYNSLNKHPLINKYMTGIFNLGPPKPKLSFVWDVDILFRYFEQQEDNCLLSDITLTQKLIILLLLLGAHKLSTIKLFSINNMVLNDLSVTFIPTDEVLKHSRKGKPLDKFEYRAYDKDKTLCLIKWLKEYISRRNKYEGLITDQLIITLRKLFKGASIDTMRRWIKYIFIVNKIVNFSPHSCRAASSSKEKRIDVNIDGIYILWQRNYRICTRWYRLQ